jgi:hypothetical protein|tara:strand:+ start:185 stop:631 length:447 start_codon:yes stop_codon:yes gene_type:complete
MKPKKKPKFTLNKLIYNNKGGQPNIRNQGEFLVWNFLPKAKDLTQKEWIREKGIAKKILTEDYKDFKFDFWLQFTLPFPIPSLAYFRKSSAKRDIKNGYYKFIVLKKIDFCPDQEYTYDIPNGTKISNYKAPNTSKLNNFFKDEKKEK